MGARRAGWLIALAACSEHAAAPPPDDAAVVPDDAAVADTPIAVDPPGLPDLRLVDEEMAGSWVVTSEVFPANDCAVIEGCVGAAGRRLLLRFTTVTANRGGSDVIVGAPPPPNVSTEMFAWSQCHMHHHVTRYTNYELLGPAGTVITGRKQSFCLEDVEPQSPGASTRGYTCLNQGISHGWADRYSSYLACQWIDVTDVPPGAYTLHVAVNPDRVLPESDYTNNDFTVDVRF